MTSDEVVSGVGDRREPGNAIVTPRQPFARTSISQRATDCFRGKKRFAVWLDESKRALELLKRNFGKLMRRLLAGDVIDLAGGDFAPALDPPLAKMTLTVPDHERFERRMADTEMIASLHKQLIQTSCDSERSEAESKNPAMLPLS